MVTLLTNARDTWVIIICISTQNSWEGRKKRRHYHRLGWHTSYYMTNTVTNHAVAKTHDAACCTRDDCYATCCA
jgi:hypothetical protein